MKKDQFAELRKAFLQYMEAARKESQAFSMMRSKNVEIKICLN